jgi:hypothetical protein
MRYRVRPFNFNSSWSIDLPGDISSYLENFIASQATDGWQFDRVNTVNIEVQCGFLARILDRKTRHIPFDLLIFKRDA